MDGLNIYVEDIICFIFVLGFFVKVKVFFVFINVLMLFGLKFGGSEMVGGVGVSVQACDVLGVVGNVGFVVEKFI